MGVRVEVGEGESVKDALRRLRELIEDEGGDHPPYPTRWHKKNHIFYQKPSVYRRRRRWVAVERRIRNLGQGPSYDTSFDLWLRPREFWFGGAWS